MIATATEGGAALFPIFYYNKEAFLAQSPQSVQRTTNDEL